MEKSITVYGYIKEYLRQDKLLKILIFNYHISNIKIELLFKYFENLEHTPEAVVEFIKNPDNGFELSMIGHRHNHLVDINTYNGVGYFQGTKCSVGSKYIKK